MHGCVSRVVAEPLAAVELSDIRSRRAHVHAGRKQLAGTVSVDHTSHDAILQLQSNSAYQDL